jgi:hypothetical protein
MAKAEGPDGFSPFARFARYVAKQCEKPDPERLAVISRFPLCQ